MTNNEALLIAEKTCKDCLANKGKCTEEERDKCWIYNAKAALFYSVPAEPIAKGYIKTPYGATERLYCSHCRKPIKNNNKFKFCAHCGKAIDWSVIE